MTEHSDNSNHHLRAERKEKARQKAAKYFGKQYPQSPLPVSEDYTKFSKREVLLGNVLGKGAFGIVWEVNGIWLDERSSVPVFDHSVHSKSSASGHQSSHSSSGRPDASARSFIARHCTRHESQRTVMTESTASDSSSPPEHNARYAIKALSNHTVNSTEDEKLFFQGLLGMAMEARLLSKMEPHPHIIKMRACAEGDPFHEDFFIVMDRLYGTLEDRLNEWQQWERKNALWTTFIPNRRKKQWEPRYEACHDLASALAHLHHHRITHRDLKPQNIGYNIRGDLTLFDFGLSRELPAKRDADGLYKMTGFCGSPRYMAPEIANSQYYDEKADVYSYAILAWQIFTLEKPFDSFRVSHMKQLVWKAPHHVRPDCQKLFKHRSLQAMLKKAWGPDIAERPSMRDIRTIMRTEMVKYSGGDDSSKASTRSSTGRRSTHVFPQRVPVAPTVSAA